MITNNKKYKIALVGYRLSIGGAERALANLSIFFDKNNIEVHNIIVIDAVSYPFAGKLLNLGKHKNGSTGLINKLERLFILKKYLKENNFDYIIDFRFRIKPFQELLIAKWLYRSKVIFSVRSYLIDHYLPKNVFLTRFMYDRCFKIISVTHKTQQLIEEKYKLKNVQTIYNPIDIDAIKIKSNESLNIDFEYIIGVGQMETNIKQFDKLIAAYANSDLPKSNIHLVLLGDGERKISLEDLAKQKNISDKVHFLGFQDNPYKYLKKAKFFALTSLNEGLPNVILEALACQTPVVAFDCLSGPSEMIINHENGILVENQNVEKLTEALDLLVNDTTLYNYCKINTLKSIEHFSVENIGKQWLDLMGIK
jgi:glycosyltransferase involved in cell wall biosynthesis